MDEDCGGEGSWFQCVARIIMKEVERKKGKISAVTSKECSPVCREMDTISSLNIGDDTGSTGYSLKAY